MIQKINKISSSQIFFLNFLWILSGIKYNNIRMVKYKTINSFSQKPSVPQICSYILYLMQIIIFFVIIQNRYISVATKIIMNIIIGVSFIIHIAITLWTSLSDPSDSFMIAYRNNRQSVADQNVLNMLYCDLCHSYVQVSSRHCRTCERCVQNFDHHCMWINNCIGAKNYKKFLIMVISTLLTMTIYIISGILLWSQNNFMGFIIQMGFVWASSIIVSIFIILISNLIGLHIYLAYLGITTYEFIMNSRAKQSNKKKQKNKSQQITNETLQMGNQQEKNSNQIIKVYQVNQLNQNNQKYNEERTIEVIKNKSNEMSKASVHNLKQSPKILGIFPASQQKLTKILPYTQKQNQNAISRNQGQEEYNSIQSDKQSVRISQFFTRNRSLAILVNSDAIKPQKPKKLAEPQTCKNSRQLKKKQVFKKAK